MFHALINIVEEGKQEEVGGERESERGREKNEWMKTNNPMGTLVEKAGHPLMRNIRLASESL